MANGKLSTALRNDWGQDIITRLDAGAGPAQIRFYAGTQPASVNTAITGQTLLGTLTCSDPCGTVTNGVVTFNAVTQDSEADATGTASFARLTDSDGNAVVDLDVTATGGGGAITMNTVAIVIGGPILMNSLVFTIPGA